MYPLVALTVLISTPTAPHPDEAAAVEAIRAFGARVERGPDGRVIGVDLYHNRNFADATSRRWPR
jgi:hypothetical protein